MSEDAKTLLKDARQLVAEKDYAGALALLKKTLALDPKSVPAAVLTGLCYHKSGQYDLSRKAYDAVLRTQPDQPLALQVHCPASSLLTLPSYWSYAA